MILVNWRESINSVYKIFHNIFFEQTVAEALSNIWIFIIVLLMMLFFLWLGFFIWGLVWWGIGFILLLILLIFDSIFDTKFGFYNPMFLTERWLESIPYLDFIDQIME